MAPKINIPKIGFFTMLRKASSINRDLVNEFKKILDQNNGLIKFTFPEKLLLTDNAELVQHFLQKNQKNYIKTALIRNTLKKEIGNGLFTSNGSYWLKQRRAIQPGFHKKKLEGISTIMQEEILKHMDTVLDSYAETNEEIDLVEEMTQLASKIVAKSLFGQNFDNEKIDIVDKSIEDTANFIVKIARKPYLKPWLRINGTYKSIQEKKEARDNLITNFIKERKEKKQVKDDLLGMLLETQYEDGSYMTNEQLLDEVVVLMIAGYETSSMTLAWAFYELLKNPEIEEKLLQSTAESIGDEIPSLDNIRHLSYSRQILEETMRFYPVVWLLDREPLEDDNFKGIQIKKGENVAAFVYGLHHNAKYWPLPETFDPERFTPENKKKHVPFSYIPFGGGPRMCIGKNFALMEMQYILIMLVRRYKFTLSPNQEITFKPLLTLCPSSGIKVRLTKRNQNP